MKTARSKLLLAMAGGAAVVYAAIGVPTSTGAGIYTSAGHAATTQKLASVTPNPTNSLDCNGYSKLYKPVKPGLKALCADPRAIDNGSYYSRSRSAGRFYDNGHYVGHDEPSVKFISSASGSGNTQTYFMQLPNDPTAQPTTSPTGSTTSNQGELTPAFWFGLPLCDSNSWPTAAGTRSDGAGGFHNCTPDSDANAPNPGNPGNTGGGSAVMELQFYPPGYGPSFDGISCDPTKYCAAINIDSFEATCSASTCSANPNCAEPVNYAFLTLDGVPTGPPSPQLNAYSTFSANTDTLKMSQSDSVRVTIFDTAHGIETKVDDLTTGTAGFMIASASNGFMQTDPTTCNGNPYDFHAEYNTAAQGNLVPWTALEFGVLISNETGHFEPCSAGLSNQRPFTATFSPSGDTFADNSAFQTCSGTFETQGGAATSEFCNTNTFVCSGNTEGNVPCSQVTNHCEASDYPCFQAGSRTVTVNGVNQTWTWPVTGCIANVDQNGDLDFDGSSYIADWADGTANHPTSLKFLGPFDASGNTYTSTQFETNAPASEEHCNFSTFSGCVVPPPGPNAFYPFWSLENTQGLSGVSPSVVGACVWNFGNTSAGVTMNSFGGDAQYGTQSGFFPGTMISSPAANPAVNLPCPTLNESQTAPAPPVISSVSPSNGLFSASTKVTVAGSNFSGTVPTAYTVQSVRVGSTSFSTICSNPATPTVKPCFTVNSPTQLTVWVPTASPGTVDITATNPGGTSATSAADRFTYLPFTQLYVMDAYGALHSVPASGSLPAQWNFKIGRAVVLLPNGTGGYVLDGWGGIHPFGAALGTHGGMYWRGWDIARGIVLVPDGLGGASGGYVLDGWGGMHPFGVGNSAPPPSITVGPFWNGWDIARGVVINSAGTGGYILDGWGGIHPYAASGAPIPGNPTVFGYWSGWDIARSITLGPDGADGYVLDGWGGIHPYGIDSGHAPPAPATFTYWRGWDIARSVVVQPGQISQGWTLDGWGGVHGFGGAPSWDTGASTPGQDINRALAVH